MVSYRENKACPHTHYSYKSQRMKAFETHDIHDFATDVVPVGHRHWRGLSVGNVLSMSE